MYGMSNIIMTMVMLLFMFRYYRNRNCRHSYCDVNRGCYGNYMCDMSHVTMTLLVRLRDISNCDASHG